MKFNLKCVESLPRMDNLVLLVKFILTVVSSIICTLEITISDVFLQAHEETISFLLKDL